MSESIGASLEESYVLLSAIADEFGMDRSNARQYFIKNNINLFKVRKPGNGSQKMLAVTPGDADLIRSIRLKDGFSIGEDFPELPTLNVDDKGYFYLLLLVPELSEYRIKVGYAGSLESRLAAHRTTCPTLQVVKSWQCRRTWEDAAVSCASLVSTRVGVEVFDCADVPGLVSKLDMLFNLISGQ